MKKHLKKIIIGIITLIVGGGIALGATSTTDVPYSFSQGSINFDTSTGILGVGEYGIASKNQIFANIDGTMKEYEAGEIDYTLLQEIQFLGTRYEDVFSNGEKKQVTKEQYSTKRNILPIKKRGIKKAEAAIANEATAQADSVGFVNSLTLSIDCTETDRGVLTFVVLRTLGDITGVTHNTDTMTSEVESLNNNVAGVEMWSRTAADSGDNNVVISLSEFRVLSMFNICLSGTDQSAIIEATNSTTPAFGTSVSDSVTTITDNAWVFSGLNLQTAQALTPDSGETELNDTDHSDSNLGQFGVSFIARVTAGSETMGWSWSAGDNHAFILGVVKPSVAAAATASVDNGTILFE